MAFSQEVRIKIGGDTSSLEGSFRRAERAAEASGRKIGSSLSGGDKGADRAGRDLVSFRRRQAFEQADTVGKIRIVTERLAALSYRRQQAEDGTAQALRLQLQMERDRAQLLKLQRQAQSERVAAESKGAEGGGGGGFFSPKNLASMLVRGVGAAVIFGLERARAAQQGEIQIAGAQEAAGAAGLESLRARFSAVGGLQGQLRQGRGREKDLEVQKSFEQNRVNMLSTGAQGLVSKAFPEELNKARDNVIAINAEIQKQHDQNALTEREIERQLALYISERDAIVEISRIRNEGKATEKAIAEIELEAAQRRFKAEQKSGTPEGRAKADVAVQQAKAARDAASRSLSQEVATYQSRKQAIEDTVKLQARGADNALAVAKVELAAAERQLEIEKKFGQPNTVRAAELALAAKRQALALTERERAQMRAEIQSEGQALRQTQAARERGEASALRLARIELKRLEDLRRRDIEEKRIVAGSLEDEARLLEIEKQRANVRSAAMNVRAQEAELARNFSQEAAQGRTFANGRPRPRSESERLAARAQQYRDRARSMVLQGSTGQGPGFYIDAARRDEGTVAGRLAAASKSVKPPPGTQDLTALKGELVNANIILGAIRDLLKDED